MKKILLILIMPVFMGFKAGNDIDETKMNRDLEIAKNILATLVKSGSHSFFSGESIDASYIKGYGVVFTIPEHFVYFHSNGFMAIPALPPIPDIDVIVEVDPVIEEFDEENLSDEEKAAQREIIREQKREVQRQEQEIKRQVQKMELQREEIERAREKARIKVHEAKAWQGLEDVEPIDWEEVMITFMTDYADLIGQLQPNERIVIKQKSPFQQAVLAWSHYQDEDNEKEEAANTSAEVLRKDVTAYKSGKINKEQFVDRIVLKKKS